MLKIRLDTLESFLDLDGKYPEPQFNASKITITDISIPSSTQAPHVPLSDRITIVLAIKHAKENGYA